MGAIIVLVMTNGLIRLGFGTGFNQMVLGLLLAVAVVLDIRWLKNRAQGAERGLCRADPSPHGRDAIGSARLRHALRAQQPPRRRPNISASARLEGPEDVILDRDDHLYCGTRHGEIVRFFAPDYKRSEVFAHTGGFPLGLAFDREGNLLSCVGAMGLYSISTAGEVTKLSRRDPPDLDLDRRRRPAARSQRLRRRAGRPHLLHRFHHALRRARMGAGFDREPADRPPAVLRPQDRQDDDDPRPLPLRQRRLHRPRRHVAVHGGKLGLPRAPLLVRRAEEGPGRVRDQGHARLSRQHQPRFRWHLLDGLARHAHAELRSRPALARHAQAHDPPPAGRRMAVPQHQHRRRSEVRRERGASSRPSAT